MGEIERAKKEKRGYYATISDKEHKWAKRGLNARTTTIAVGEEGDLDAPLAGIIWVNEGPGDPLRGRHVHHCDAINLVVRGAMYMDGHWLRPGHAKVVPAELNYGDQVCCPDGVIFLEIFADHYGARPDFDNPRDQVYFEEVHGTELFGNDESGAPALKGKRL